MLHIIAQKLFSLLQKPILKSLKSQIDPTKMPQHLGLILDGNRRYAKHLGLTRREGHAHGAKKMKEVVQWCRQVGIKYLTIWVFSNENWTRGEEEVGDLTSVFMSEAEEELNNHEFKKNGVKLNIVGDYTKFPKKLIDMLVELEKQTAECTNAVLNVCLGYGGRQEVVRAVNQLLQTVSPKQLVTEELLANNMYLKDQPTVSYVVRTSGEQRHSGFLLWDSPYAEYYFSKVMWPAFNELEFYKAMLDFQRRQRRFGK